MQPIFRLYLDVEDYKSVKDVMESGQISRGKLPSVFEDEFSKYIGCRHSIVLNSGTTALWLAVHVLGLPAGSEVIVPSLTFVATAFAPIYCGLKPVFAEIEPGTFNLSPEDVERRITPRTKAIIPVHYAGQPVKLEAINEIARRNGLIVIEDAAHAVGAKYQGKNIGNISDLTAFSFFATKNMTGGEGGVVCTNNTIWAEKIRLMKAHGIKPLEDGPKASGYYDVVSIGYNCHLSNLNVGLLRSQLKRLDELNSMRRSNAEYLTSLLKEIPSVETPETGDGNDHIFHLYTIKLKPDDLKMSRDEIVETLIKEGVGVGVYYRPAHLFSYFREHYGYGVGDLPVTEDVTNRLITLPMYPQLSKADLERIYLVFKKVLNRRMV